MTHNVRNGRPVEKLKMAALLCLSTSLAGAILMACGGSSGGGTGSTSTVSGGGSTGSGATGSGTSTPVVINRPAIPAAAPDGVDFHPAGKGWTLSWSDEFTGSALDATKWSMEHACWGGGNNEKQCYTNRVDNVEVVNGLLRLIALEEEFTGPDFPGDSQQKTQPYTSGKVITQNLADWTYGRFEMRAKLPEGQGAWPAFWMLGATDTYAGGWPLIGEIDIMEAINLGARCDVCTGVDGENRTSSALHFGSAFPNNQNITNRTKLSDDTNPADGYHVWATEWGKGVIHWYLDGVRYASIENDAWYTDADLTNPDAPFDAPFYIILNLAIGGDYPEPFNDGGIAESTLPNQFLIDWVRVYQCSEDMDTGLACMNDE